MANRCEWEDGEFKVCNLADKIKTTRILYDIDKHGKDLVAEFSFCPFCGADIRKPVEIKVGMFGRFWEDSYPNQEWGELAAIHEKGSCQYETIDETFYTKFTPGLPTGFNQDGTPKEESD